MRLQLDLEILKRTFELIFANVKAHAPIVRYRRTTALLRCKGACAYKWGFRVIYGPDYLGS